MSIFGSDPDNPVSGDMPADSLEGSDTVMGLPDEDNGPVNDIGGVGSTAATLPEDD